MKQPPASPAATVLFVIGNRLPTDMPPDPYTIADYVKAGEQLRALGYNIISAHGVPPGARAEHLAKCHGVAVTDQYDEASAGPEMISLLRLAYALNMPELPVISWAKCAAPESADWYREVFKGAL